MKQVLTLSCRIEVPVTLRGRVEATLHAFADACNFVREAAEVAGIKNKVKLQHLIYRELRIRFGLSANLAIRAIARVTTILKANHRQSHFGATSADYDSRIFRFREADWTVSLTLLGGAERFKLEIGEYQRRRLAGRRPTSAKLVKRKDGTCYLHIALDHDSPKSVEPTGFLGVDLGIKNLASLSTGERFGGAETDARRERYRAIRAALQKKGTKGAKRLLKRLSGRERRYMSWVNHTISARVVRFARHHGLAISLEDLSGIRSRARGHKPQRRRLHRWAFRQLRGYLEYKSLRDGVALVLVNPAFTSQTCHRCLHIGRRDGEAFACDHCGYAGHADYNGARNISRLGACVTRPEHPLVCHLAG